MALTLNDIIRVAARCVLDGQDVVQVYHFKLTELFNDLATMISEIRNAFSSAYSQIASYQTVELSADDLTISNLTQDEQYGQHTWPVAYGGGSDGTNERLPPPVSVLVLNRTYTTRTKGRKFFSGFTEVNLADGLWGTGIQTACAAVCNDLVRGNITGPPGILAGGVYSPTLLSHILSYETATTNNPGYQRRRRIGRGS